MLRVILWALGTGFVTGAVWFAILFFRRHPTQPSEPPALPATPKALEDVTRRLSELEERLDAAEYLRQRDKFGQPRKPPT